LAESPASVRRQLDLAEDSALPFRTKIPTLGSPELDRKVATSGIDDVLATVCTTTLGSAPNSPLLGRGRDEESHPFIHSTAVGSESCMLDTIGEQTRCRSMSSPWKLGDRRPGNNSAPSTPLRGRAASERQATPRKASHPSKTSTVAALLNVNVNDPTPLDAAAAGADGSEETIGTVSSDPYRPLPGAVQPPSSRNRQKMILHKQQHAVGVQQGGGLSAVERIMPSSASSGDAASNDVIQFTTYGPAKGNVSPAAISAEC